MNILLAQYGTSNLLYSQYSKDINSTYCKKHKYSYFFRDDDTFIREFCNKEGIAIQWYKVPFILELLNNRQDVDYLVFLDLDAIISDPSFKFEEIIDSNYNFQLTDDLGHHSMFNTGVIIVKNDEWSKKFLTEWWEARNTTSGSQVKSALNWDGGMHKPDEPTIFKGSLWHEQTVLSFLCKNNPDYLRKFKSIPSKLYNSYTYGDGEKIFHAFAYNFDRYRGIKDIHEAKFSKIEEGSKIKIVYFAYCAGEYLGLIKKDIERIADSGLYSRIDEMFIVLSLPISNDNTPVRLVEDIVSKYEKIKISSCIGNKYEHYGIVKAWVESHKFNGKLLYFHAKGVTGFYSDNNEHSDWKREGDESFKEMLKYFTIDKHDVCLNKLDSYDEVIISDSYARGWPSGNFWWVNTEFLRSVHFPFESHYDRWACEFWLNRRNKKYSTYQLYDRFYFRDKFTYLPEHSFKNLDTIKEKNIILNYAKLVTLMEPENENDRNRPTEDNAVDFTEFVADNLKKNNFKGFSNIAVSFNTMGRTIPDPLVGTLKSLVISFKVEGDDTEYRLVGDEGAHLTYFIDSYSEVGYDYSNKEGKVIREVNKIN